MVVSKRVTHEGRAGGSGSDSVDRVASATETDPGSHPWRDHGGDSSEARVSRTLDDVPEPLLLFLPWRIRTCLTSSCNQGLLDMDC